MALDLEPAHFRGDNALSILAPLVGQISAAIVHLNQSKKQHPILICDEAHLLPHPALEQLPLLLNFDIALSTLAPMDSSRYLTLLARWSAIVAAHAWRKSLKRIVATDS